ncbi:MAG: ABC transporter substrate-binding protein [Candidatus Caldatribacteriota bacterium]|nr:ABC transporter substrate-binding protein [Candidatus Caldatribacteriota bacterium]
MKKKSCLLFLILGILIFVSFGECALEKEIPVGIAVEFNDHAASAYISYEKGWFKEEGLELTSYESYVSGMTLASALARGDIQVAYMCLIPAINAYANAKVPIKIVVGTHKYGYGLVVNTNKVRTVRDLERKDIRIGCVREGGSVDVLFYKTVDKYNLDEEKVLNNIQRMNPPKQILAIQMGKLDAAFLPEQWATLAEDYDFKMLLTSQEIWPAMQGSVVVVKEELIRDHPEIVKKIVIVSGKATDWINQYPRKAAEIVTRQLQKAGGDLYPDKLSEISNKMEMSPDVLFKSMKKLNYTTNINPKIVQETIDYIAQLGYIKKSFEAGDILDLRFLEE